ncbi:MAG: alanine--glyoxylate aminotransferase family protein [Deltaproteobacteria bacterium]|nr:alanine--glyoxylate aminotransferase family protein [Deltaproteobacteria bacterium]
MEAAGELAPPVRVLLGPGPSNVHSRVLKAMSTPLVGHLDPEFVRLMEETKELLRFVFQTKNALTFPISGTGSSGMEACLVNLLEAGDEAVIGVNGVFGTRMKDIVERCGAKPVVIEAPWGNVFTPEQVRDALKQCRRPKLVALVHAETSTGAWQPLEGISSIVHAAGALFVVDAVTSLGGCPVQIDDWKIDACYSGTQKCLSCPPGLSPVTFSQAALDVIRARKSKVQSWYLDLTMIEKYWGEERVYHHTAPISMNYALRESLRLIQEEGLTARFQRHRRNHEALAAGLSAMGMTLAAQEGHRLWTLNSVAIPNGVDDAGVRRQLLEEYNIEIGAGLGPLRGKVLRIGLMGESSTRSNVLLVLSALESILRKQQFSCTPGAGVSAAQAVYAAA